MRKREWHRIHVIEKTVEGQLSVSEVLLLLQRSPRQVQRLKRRCEPGTFEWVRHGNCGKPMPRALPPAVGGTLCQFARGKYVDFNDSHELEFTNYRKFRAEARIAGVE